MTPLGKGWERKLSRISKQVASIIINKRHWVVEKFTQQIICTKVVTHSANLCKIDGYIGSLTLFLPIDVNPSKFCSPICPLSLFTLAPCYICFGLVRGARGICNLLPDMLWDHWYMLFGMFHAPWYSPNGRLSVQNMTGWKISGKRQCSFSLWKFVRRQHILLKKPDILSPLPLFSEKNWTKHDNMFWGRVSLHLCLMPTLLREFLQTIWPVKLKFA
jgi:hypothetical protein